MLRSSLTVGMTLMLLSCCRAITTNYVALGDSYSSGLGAYSYGSSGSCDRSANAYPQLWANANAPASFSFGACSGATTSDVLSSQLGPLSASTTLISLTVGANDVGLSSVAETCYLENTSLCQRAIDTMEFEIKNHLPSKLGSLYRAIHAHAPNAKVVVLNYPELYDLSRPSSCPGLSAASKAALNQAINMLDSAIQAVATRHEFIFADVRRTFVRHKICDDDAWLHNVNIGDLSESYHPTAIGHSNAYYPVFASKA